MGGRHGRLTGATRELVTESSWNASARRGSIMSPLARQWTHRNGEWVGGMDASPALPANWRLNRAGTLPLCVAQLCRRLRAGKQIICKKLPLGRGTLPLGVAELCRRLRGGRRSVTASGWMAWTPHRCYPRWAGERMASGTLPLSELRLTCGLANRWSGNASARRGELCRRLRGGGRIVTASGWMAWTPHRRYPRTGD
jgi:hypothetical protein